MFEVLADLTLNLVPDLQQAHHLRVLTEIAARSGPAHRAWRASVWIKVGQLQHPEFDEPTRRTAVASRTGFTPSATAQLPRI